MTVFPFVVREPENIFPETLQRIAKYVRMSRESKGNPVDLNCHENAYCLVTILAAHRIDYRVVAGAIVGDPQVYSLAGKTRTSEEYQNEHGITNVPTVYFGEDSNGVRFTTGVRNSITRDELTDVGSVHIWVTVQTENDTYIVEPHAEMRGEYEYKPAVTRVEPLDYVTIEDVNFDFQTLQAIMGNQYDDDSRYLKNHRIFQLNESGTENVGIDDAQHTLTEYIK